MNLCIISDVSIAKIAISTFILGWTHTVEKTRWEELWTVTPHGLVMKEARIQGTGAGMEPPPEAVLKNGWYRWKPSPAPQQSVTLARSDVPGDWEICFGRMGCSVIGEWAAAAPQVTLKACR